jgi:hypothetical protein
VSTFIAGRCMQKQGEQCSGNGACTDTTFSPECTCFTGFSGYQCNACQSGFYGVNCDLCPGGGTKDRPTIDSICSHQGLCNDNYTGDGTCTCTNYFGGDNCELGGCGLGMERVYTAKSYVCRHCAINTYRNSANKSSCLPCPDGRATITSGSQNCDLCATGYYFQPRSDKCRVCLTGMMCTAKEGYVTVSTLLLERGYYRTSNESDAIMKCPLRKACEGGAAIGQESCADGFQGMCNVLSEWM